MSYIKPEDCKDGGLYRIRSRNLQLGVYRAECNSFIGIREKYDWLQLAEELHWDAGEPYGTVQPIEFVEDCPIRPLSSCLENLEDHTEMFEWLTQKESQYKK